MLLGKKILLGISGSIAAYKSAMLVRLLVKAGAEVKVLMTPAAKEFITPLTLSTLSKNPVISAFSSDPSSGIWNNHVELGLWADAMLIAPATANTISKMATGLCDNFLTAVYLSAKCPVFIAPAMDLDMYKHRSTQDNLKKLESFDPNPVKVFRPASGELASGLYGEGRMEDPETIVQFLNAHFKKNLPLQNKTILITAGPTYEPIDPVRFIGNYSSGKMGFALAEEAARQGASVKLIAGPVSLSIQNNNIRRIDVSTAQEMYEAATKNFPAADVAIMSAAVADFKAEKRIEKIKKQDGLKTLALTPTKDILARLGKMKSKKQVLVGFALETENELKNAKNKLKNKNLDFIVLNTLKDSGAGFRHDTNKITIVEKENKITKFGLKTKDEVAKDIIIKIIEKLNLKSMTWNKILFFFLISHFLNLTFSHAQELNCSVQISSQQLSDVDKTLTEAMQKSVYEFINNRKWTDDNFLSHEKIDCSILINLSERTSTDEFKGTINIQSRRPVYRTSYNTNMLSFVDNDLQFRYVQFETLEYSENSYVSELTSVLSFYVYMILGLDYDSFSPNGGTIYYQKALQVVNYAQTSNYKGWKGFEDTRNRYWMVNNILDQPFKPLRDCFYQYHLQGFDIMSEKTMDGRAAVTESLQLLQPLYRDRPNNFSMQIFFQAKMDELVKLYSAANPEEKPRILTLLTELDPGHSSKYQQIMSSK